MRTQVGIVGAGPAGLMLSHLLHREGIDSVVLEQRSREYVEKRVRAGVLEQGTVDLLAATGLGDRLRREGLVHHGIELRFEGKGHRVPLSDLAGGRAITIYGQQEVVKDLINARLAAGATLHFDVAAVSIHELHSAKPELRYSLAGESGRIECDLIAGCDGFHGIARNAVPAGVLRTYQRDYPFAWVGVLVEAPPSSDELIYARHERGFALHSMRSPTLTRLYVQCDQGDTDAEWPAARIWDELHARLAVPGWSLAEGSILEKSITGLKSFVVEPMQFGPLFLAGDAAHIVPATGAKGLNLAVADVHRLATAIVEWYRTGSRALLDGYSTACLERVWQAQAFSSYMTAMLHRPPPSDDRDGFEGRLQIARLRAVVTSRAAAAALARSYVG